MGSEAALTDKIGIDYSSSSEVNDSIVMVAVVDEGIAVNIESIDGHIDRVDNLIVVYFVEP